MTSEMERLRQMLDEASLHWEDNSTADGDVILRTKWMTAKGVKVNTIMVLTDKGGKEELLESFMPYSEIPKASLSAKEVIDAWTRAPYGIPFP